MDALEALTDPEFSAAMTATDPVAAAGIDKSSTQNLIRWYYILMIAFVGVQLAGFLFKAFRRQNG